MLFGSSSEVVTLFTELAALPSPPGEEREVADRVAAYLRALGLEVSEDDAGGRIGASAGNLLARLGPTDGTGTPLFFCAHLDTVPPQGPIDPVVADGVRDALARTRRLNDDGRLCVAVAARCCAVGPGRVAADTPLQQDGGRSEQRRRARQVHRVEP